MRLGGTNCVDNASVTPVLIVLQENSSVRSIMIDRARSSSKRGKRTDNFHLSLVIECGGMRGVSAAGFIRVISESGLTDAFDTLHGSSAGACAAAYFLAQQPDEGRKIYHDISNRKVVNPFRFFSQPCMVDTDYIVDEIFSKKRRLDIDKITSEPGVLNIVTTSALDGSPAVHKNFQNGEEIFRALKATLRVPGPFEYGIEIDGKRHLDGGLVAPIPIFSAIDAGATHILVICTQRSQDYASNRRFFEGLALRVLYGGELQRKFLAANTGDRRTWKLAGAQSPVKTETLIRPDSATYCGWFTIETDVLRKVEEESIEIAQAYLRNSSGC
jgi:predicted patatin/cPLA2 family phospholipase